jgi:hypothetical protein
MPSRLQRRIYWRCPACSRVLSVFEKINGVTFNQATLCPSCKSQNTIDIDGSSEELKLSVKCLVAKKGTESTPRIR